MQVHHLACWSPVPPFFPSPVPRWLTEDRLLRGRKLPHVYCFNVRFAFSHRGFGVRMLQLGSVLEGQFLLGSTKQRRLMRDPLKVCIHDLLGLQGFRLLKESLPESVIRYFESHDLLEPLLFHFKKIFLRSFKRWALKFLKTHPLWPKAVLVLQRPLTNIPYKYVS